MRNFIGGVAVATAGLAAQSAAADVSAEDVWENMMAPYKALNAEIVAEPVREGDRLIVENLTVRFGFDEGVGQVLLTTNGVTFEENGDGTVSVLYPEKAEMEARLEDTLDDASEALILTLETNGAALEQIASGEPGDVIHSVVYRDVVQDMRLTFPASVGGTDIGVNVRAASGEGTYRVTEGDLVSMSTGYAYDAVDIMTIVEEMVESPDGDDPIMTRNETVQHMTGLKLDFEAALPKGVLSIMNLSQGLRDGFRLGLRSTVESSRAKEAHYVDGVQVETLTVESGAQDVEMRLDRAGLAINGDIKELASALTGQLMPVTTAIGIAEVEARFSMPVNRTDGPGEMIVALSLDGLELDDGSWSMLDPGGALPRDPAALGFDATFAVEVLVDLLDIDARQSVADAQVFLLQGLDLRNLLLKVAGARLTGDADVAFDNDDLETYDGLPAPEGMVNLVLEGGNALLDRLVDARLLPEDQAGGVRMMMGLFAVKGEGEDTLTSTIEMKPGGVIEANGQRVR